MIRSSPRASRQGRIASGWLPYGAPLTCAPAPRDSRQRRARYTPVLRVVVHPAQHHLSASPVCPTCKYDSNLHLTPHLPYACIFTSHLLYDSNLQLTLRLPLRLHLTETCRLRLFADRRDLVLFKFDLIRVYIHLQIGEILSYLWNLPQVGAHCNCKPASCLPGGQVG